MRMTDTLGLCGEIWDEYKPALKMLEQTIGEHGWRQVIDGHQISTREAGKSSCVFFVKVFPDLEKAIAVLQTIHDRMPNVNCELQLMPDGTWDRGAGRGYYDRTRRGEYLQHKGMCCPVLVDVQNIMREAWTSSYKSPSSQTVLSRAGGVPEER